MTIAFYFIRLTGVACALAATSVVHAAPEEIQVYMDEINKPGEIGLDMHLNNVIDGQSGVDYPGAQPSVHRTRVTPEFSLGLGSGFEAGLYLPIATIGSDAVVRAQGAKVRIKWINPRHKEDGFYYGANLEVGRVAHALDQNPWNGELKLISGWRGGRVSFATNVNFDFVIAGPANGPTTLDVDTKFAYRLSPKWSFGIESYNGQGPLRSLVNFRTNEQATFLAADAHLGRWDVNFGLGKGYGANADSVIAKMILSVPLPQFKH